MGQRLVITIENMGREIAKIYYHWSAYSFSALRETQKVLNCICDGEDKSESELLLRLIRFCEKNGGGIRATNEEFEYIKNLYPNEIFKTDDYSRNQGLIALSENGMAGLQSWSEGDITIHIDKDRISNSVYCDYTIDEYNEERQEWDENFEPLTLDDITDIGYDLGDISFEEIDDVIEELRNVDFVCRHGDTVYSLIE